MANLGLGAFLAFSSVVAYLPYRPYRPYIASVGPLWGHMARFFASVGPLWGPYIASVGPSVGPSVGLDTEPRIWAPSRQI